MDVSEQPKKPVGGAYGQFMSENRAAFAKECAGKPVSAVAKLASERWKTLGEAEKAKFQKKFDIVNEQYAKDLEAFLAAGGEVKSSKMQSSKRKSNEDVEDGKKCAKKNPDAPKKPVGGAYGCFIAANREKFQKACPGQSISEVTKVAAQHWKKLSLEERKPFEEEYQVKKTAYAEAMKTYSASS